MVVLIIYSAKEYTNIHGNRCKKCFLAREITFEWL